MSKMLFKSKPNRKANDLVQTLSLTFLTALSNIKAEDLSLSSVRVNHKIESLTTTELLTYCICKIYGIQSVIVVEFKKPFPTDDKFIESFKDNYMGTIDKNMSKSELIELAKPLSIYSHSQHLNQWLQPQFSMLKDSFTKAGLSADECAELEQLFKNSFKPVDEWIKTRNSALKSKIDPLTKFIKRGY